jgi:hypothetical protein
MYRRPRFLEIIIAIREEMAREADFDVDLLVENVRTGHRAARRTSHSLKAEDANGKRQELKSAKPRTKRKSV